MNNDSWQSPVKLQKTIIFESSTGAAETKK